MKKQLSDYIKTWEDFERFCNLFLKKEVSPLVKVYDAAGPDGGIDADFTGTYAGKEGVWIFQFKFFNPTMDKTRARRQLISAVNGGKRKKGELDKAASLRCDHYVLLTNTNLTAGNKGKIEAAKNGKGYAFSFTCWDAEDLITMTDVFPYILNSFRDVHLPVFLQWQDMFRPAVAGEQPLLRYDYETFGREAEISHFQDFLRDENKRLLLVYGSGGIGKTKLAIEFAKTVEREHQEYEPLFVREAVDKFEEVFGDVPPNRKYLFFVDDAHDFMDNIGGIKVLLNSPEYRNVNKAVLLTRKPFKATVKSYFLRAVLPDAAIAEREILKLSLEETRNFIRAHTRIPDGSLLAHLTAIGRDTPLIAVLVIDLFNKGFDLNDLTTEELVECAFESYLKDIFSHHLQELDKRHRKLLDWFSGIGPVGTEDERITAKLAELLQVESHEIEHYRDALLQYGLLVQIGRKQRVFPYALGDYILRQACFLSDQKPSSFHQRLLEEFLPILSVNVIKNLARVESVAGESSLLDEHVAWLRAQVREGDNATRMGILTYMEGISYFRPDDAVEIFNIILDNPNDEDTQSGIFIVKHPELACRIAREARKTIHTLSGFGKTLGIIQKLLLMDNMAIQRVDSPENLLTEMTRFQTGKIFAYQMHALETFAAWQTEDKLELSLPMLAALESLLVLDFCETFSQGGSLHFSWHSLKYTQGLIDLRTRAFDLIERCLRTSKHSSVRERAVASIRSVMHPFRSPMRNKAASDMEEAGLAILRQERERLFDILGSQFQTESDFTVLNAIEACLNGYTNASDSFVKDKAKELLAKFNEQDTHERYLLYRQFIGKFRDWDLGPEETQKFVGRYVSKYSPAEFATLMRDCIGIAEKGWNDGSATDFLRTIGENHPTYGDALLDHILAWQIDESHYAAGYAAGLLVGMRQSDSDKAKEAIRRLLNYDSLFAKCIVAGSYRLPYGKERFDQEDLRILDNFSETTNLHLRLYVAESLGNFYAVDVDTVLEILVTLATDKSPAVILAATRVLLSEELEISPQHRLDVYKRFMHNRLRLEQIDPWAELVLHTIFQSDPVWVIKFFEKRIAHKAAFDTNSNLFKYDAVPYRPHHLFQDVNWDDEDAMAALRRVRDWVFAPLPDQEWEAPALLASMIGGSNPQNREVNINKSMQKLFEEWIDSGDSDKLCGTAYLMWKFCADKVFYSIAESLLIKSGGDKRVQDGITDSLRAGTHSRGVGEPSARDLQQIEDLKMLRDKPKQAQVVVEFANRLIRMIEGEIALEQQRDEEFMEGVGW